MSTKSAGDTVTQQATYLLSRKALLDHLEEKEKLLKPKVTASKSREPYFQEMLIKKYITLREDLQQLQHIAQTSKGTKAYGETWDNKTIAQELRILLHNFTDFLKNSGFLPT